MDLILDELYFGIIDMNTSCFNQNSNIVKAMVTLIGVENILTKLLDGKEKRLFSDSTNA